jgi:hypothetical protein
MFLRKRVHKGMKTKGGRCKKVQRVLEFAVVEGFWNHLVPLPPVLQKRGWKVLRTKGWVDKKEKKEAVFC